MSFKKLKILLLAPSPDYTGGIAAWTRHILNYYKESKLQDIKLSLLPMNRSRFISYDSSFFLRLRTGIRDYLSIFFHFKQTLKKEKPDVVHIVSSASYGLFKDIILQRICKQKKIKHLLHYHFGRIPELYAQKKWEWKILSYVIKHSNLTIVMDQISYNTLIEAGLKNIALIANPISPQILDFISKNIETERINRKILFAGHVIPTKGIFELVEACSQISDIKLIIVGKYKENIKNALLESASSKGNTDWIEIHGEIPPDEVLKTMLSTSIFALPTYTEGFPNVILESMACGCAIVSTPVGAIPEMLNIQDTDNSCGICVEPQNAALLQQAIETYLHNETLAALHGSNARQRVNIQYSMPAIWQKLITNWKEIAQ